MRLITAFGCCLLLATFVTTSPDVSHLKYSRRPYKKLLVTTTAIPNTKSDALRKESTYTFKPRLLIRKGIRNGKLTTALPTAISTPVTETVATQSTTATSTSPTTTNRPRMRTTENDDILSVIDNSDSIRSDGTDGKRRERDGTSLQDAWDIRHNIPGEPGVDYPIYFQAPDSKFDCENRHDGYYADTEARCQVFHVCANTALEERGFIFLCPNGTVFSQENFVCDWYTNVNCPESEKYYYKNEELGRFIGSKEEMLLEVQKMFDYTLRNLLNTKPNTNQNGGKESNGNGNDIGSENSIAGDENLDQKFGNFSAIPILNPKMRKTGNTSNGKGKTSKDDEIYISNLGELSTDPGADFDINVVKQQAKLKAEAAIKSKAGSFAELWGQDIEQLDTILSQNRLKKSSDGNLFIDVSIPSVTPAASTVTKRDVSHLLTTPEYIPPNRYLPSLRKINLRPPGGYHYEPGPQTYVSNSNPASAIHRNVQQQIPGIVITPSIGQSLGHVVTQGPSAPQKISLTQSTVNQGLPPLKITTEHSVFQQQNKLRPIVVPDTPLRVVTQRPVQQQQKFITSQQEIGGLQGGQARPIQEQYQYTFPNQQRPQIQKNTNHFVQSSQELHEFQAGQAHYRPYESSFVVDRPAAKPVIPSQFQFGTEQRINYDNDATGPGGENVIVNIVPSINWYLNDARDRNSYFAAIQRGLVPSENLQFNQGHLRYGTPLEYQNHNSFGQQYPIGSGGRHIGQSFSRGIDTPSTYAQNSNRRIDNANVVLPVDKGMDAVFRGLSSYNAPLGSIGKLPCDSDSVSGQS